MERSLTELAPRAKSKAAVKKQAAKLRRELTLALENERKQRGIVKDERAQGDAIYWPIYNLDITNPSSAKDLEHLPPEQLAEDILKKEQRIAEIMGEIRQALVGAL